MSLTMFVAAVIGLGVFAIKQGRKNSQKRQEALHELLNGSDNRETVSDTKLVTAQDMPPKVRKCRELSEVKVPADCVFKEELETLLYMSKTYPKDMSLDLYEPLYPSDISLFESRTGVKLTDELKAFYLFSNGLFINGTTLELLPLDMVESYYNMGYCDFAEKGDADKYLIIGSEVGDGEYVLMEKETGSIHTVFEGETCEEGTVQDILYWAIEFVYEGFGCKDEKIRNYLVEGHLK